MAEIAKPNIEKLGKKGQITFLFYNDENRFDKIETLFDGNLNTHTGYGVLLSPTNSDRKIIFELHQKSNIWAYGQKYTDGGGSTPKPVSLYEKSNNDEDFKLIQSNIPTKDNEWYLLANNLEKGIYKMTYTSAYTMFTEWYVEDINPYRCLINQNQNYYSTKSNFLNLGQTKDNTQLENWYNKYGADDVNVITQNLNNKEFPMSKDENGIWKTDFQLDMNEVIDNIELVDIDEENKSIKYNCNDYRILDLCDDQFKLTMCKIK
ncbi:hypothetical protein CBO05C_3148 [Clostridium botulinum B str. Osaka05]|uniref:Uncharacterized protein n=1 Tax=Clostridium botulinum B str. Osaka05 TaxID=1407017 RepID=A0A0S6U9S0_CLOBO|nr:hypothetical protein [Clostridium botulinum]GAE03458.1 hypothetical protein CBO05C_3148 [Clostridium botulinum B str. Osaka05]